MQKHKPDGPSALVLQWVKVNSTGSARRYLDRLDLSEGDALYSRCSDICPWYAEVIFNSRFMLRRMVEKRLAASSVPCQIILLGAGVSPLALELLETGGDKISRIFEIDIKNLSAKKRIYADVAPAAKGLITWIEADLNAFARLEKHGIHHSEPCIVVAEGITYLMPQKTLERLAGVFSSPDRKNYFAAEYLVPDGQITALRRELPRNIFDAMVSPPGYDGMTTYNRASISALFRAEGGEPVEHYTLSDMEKLRTGENKFFPSPEQGWIEMIAAEL